MSEIANPHDAKSRRDFIYFATASAGTVATGAAVWPLINSMNPSADVIALSVVEVDLDGVAPGTRITVKWNGKPVFIDHRTEERIAKARADDTATLPDQAHDADRAVRPEWLVVIGVCTHLGCIPLGQRGADPLGDWGGWFCPCHGSHYDTAGRIRKGPAPRNLDLPSYEFKSDTLVSIG
ncbi:ubiquinol-cytochrome c reductase iron-sulfur subunit [Primorskyibacter aestuariivivens]|uniref:ubiquinol-cytochrome c reductase iron-sulfur subunit n=1 Tax=Primorskyibacter aestuariivivens TaxID=1888912 RepID=UPI0023010F39|nr:ubiquinol-cytochrome c reductase iron-sulfur subunit [Primorskyibacter aestuariivivens]MDA7429201.1 ubiquinol-cytochrome c reductase iron-sulfur subunit [Primorskyibacter aestuariivivens]